MLFAFVQYKTIFGYDIEPRPRDGYRAEDYRRLYRQWQAFGKCCLVASFAMALYGCALHMWKERVRSALRCYAITFGLIELAYISLQLRSIPYLRLADTAARFGSGRGSLEPPRIEAPHRGNLTLMERCLEVINQQPPEVLEEMGLAALPPLMSAHNQLARRAAAEGAVRLVEICQCLPHITELDLEPVGHEITSQQLIQIFTACPSLQKVGLKGCWRADAEVLATLFSNSSSTLQELDLTNFMGCLTDESINWKVGFPKLKKLVFKGCNTQQIQELLKRDMPVVAHLELPHGRFLMATPNNYLFHARKSLQTFGGIPPWGCTFFPYEKMKLTQWRLSLWSVKRRRAYLAQYENVKANYPKLYDQAQRQRESPLGIDAYSALLGIRERVQTPRYGTLKVSDEDIVLLKPDELPSPKLPFVPKWAKAHLQELQIDNVGHRFTADEVLGTLCAPLQALTRLDFEAKDQALDSLFGALQSHAPQLTHLKLRFRTRSKSSETPHQPIHLTDAQADQLAKACPGLVSLKLNGGIQLSHDTCRRLVERLPHLRILHATVEGIEGAFDPTVFSQFTELGIAVPPDRMLDTLRACPHLEYLHPRSLDLASINQAEFDNELATLIAELRSPLKLRVFPIKVTPLNANLLASLLAHLPHLEEVWVRLLPDISPADWETVATALPSRVSKILFVFDPVRASDLRTVIDRCPHVSAIGLWTVRNLTQDDLNTVFASPSQIGSLCLLDTALELPEGIRSSAWGKSLY